MIEKRVNLLFLAGLLTTVFTFASTGTSQAGIDRSCHRTFITFNNLFNTYWSAAGVGYVNWRLAGDLNIYDRCNHGGITGVLYVSPGVINVKQGSYRLGFWYQTSGYARWTYNYLTFTRGLGDGYWDAFDVHTEDNIGLAPKWRITWVRTSSYLVFNGVPGASRHVNCSGITRACSGGMGL